MTEGDRETYFQKTMTQINGWNPITQGVVTRCHEWETAGLQYEEKQQRFHCLKFWSICFSECLCFRHSSCGGGCLNMIGYLSNCKNNWLFFWWSCRWMRKYWICSLVKTCWCYFLLAHGWPVNYNGFHTHKPMIHI